MGLFGNKDTTTTTHPQTTTTTTDNRKSGFFNNNRNSAATTTTVDHHNNTKSHGFLHRNTEDSSITAARERIVQAEQAERNADRALMEARAAVKAAREHCRRLELEAAEEARLAKIKQKEAKNMTKKTRTLGRHDHV
ncbi:hypothetical protein MMC25_000373 [Agyrium rufum]|nr:hypothetical protein [Agyrium rufum]